MAGAAQGRVAKALAGSRDSQSATVCKLATYRTAHKHHSTQAQGLGHSSKQLEAIQAKHTLLLKSLWQQGGSYLLGVPPSLLWVPPLLCWVPLLRVAGGRACTCSNLQCQQARGLEQLLCCLAVGLSCTRLVRPHSRGAEMPWTWL